MPIKYLQWITITIMVQSVTKFWASCRSFSRIVARFYFGCLYFDAVAQTLFILKYRRCACLWGAVKEAKELKRMKWSRNWKFVPISFPSMCITWFGFCMIIKGLTSEALISKYKFSRLISIHFLKEYVERIWFKIKAFPIRWSFH